MKQIEPVYILIAAKCKMVREATGKKQQEVAKAVGWTRASVANFETGHTRITLHALEKLAAALGTTPKHLLRGIWT